MAVFFNISTDTALIHSGVRDSDELGNVVDRVEWEIIDRYRQRDHCNVSIATQFFQFEGGVDPNEEPVVRLLGYDEDEPADSDDGLKEALKRTIGDVASWVLKNYDTDPDVVSEKQGQRAVTYRSGVPSRNEWPLGWDIKLSNFDARIDRFGI